MFMKQSYTVGCTHIQEHILSVPLNHFEPSGETITLFARELRILECPNSASFPLLVFFNGGPGYENTRNWTGTAWLARALKQYRVVLMDQRGTGRSSPVTEKTLTNTKDPKGLAHYLTLFRADSIVKDAEYLRHHLIGDRPWTVLGQSFGGFCVCTYLSFAAHGLERVLIAGGLPPIGQKLEDVYRYTYKTLINKNKDLYLTYPF